MPDFSLEAREILSMPRGSFGMSVISPIEVIRREFKSEAISSLRSNPILAPESREAIFRRPAFC